MATVNMKFRQLFFRSVVTVTALWYLPPQAAAQDEIINRSSIQLDSVMKCCFHMEAAVLESTHPIVDFAIDSLHRVAYLVTNVEPDKKSSTKGLVTAYDLNANQNLWSVPINIKTEKITLVDSSILISRIMSTRCLDRRTGEILWTKPVTYLSYFPKTGKLLTCSTNPPSDLNAVELQSGRIIWVYDAEMPIEVESLLMVGDTSIAFSSKGIHYLSLSSGKGWYHKHKLGVAGGNGGTITSAYMIGGLIGGLLTTAIIAATNSSTKYKANKELGSEQLNIAAEKGRIYFGSLNEITCYNEKGAQLWRSFFNYENVASPKLFIADESIYAVNYGIALIPNSAPVNGIPSVQKINKWTGVEEASTDYVNDSKEFIIDFLKLDESLVIVGNNRIVELDLNHLEPITNKVFGAATSTVGLKEITGSSGYAKNGNTFELLENVTDETFVFENTGGMKVQFNKAMEPIQVVHKIRYFDIQKNLGERILVSNYRESYLIDKDGTLLTPIEVNERTNFVGNLIYNIKDSKLVMMQLN